MDSKPTTRSRERGGRILVLLSGRLLRWPEEDGPFARVICADGGARHALEHGVRPDTIVGDFDSFPEEEVESYELLRGVRRRRYPAAKEATDGELAVAAALDAGATEVVIAGALGGRLDHTLANVALLVRVDDAVRSPDASPFPSAWVTDGEERAYVLRGGRAGGGEGRLVLRGQAGDRLSVLPASERLAGLSIDGVRWPLDRATVRLGETLTVSNAFAGERAELRLADGTAWVTTGRWGPGDES